jgi:pyruvyltransferase
MAQKRPMVELYGVRFNLARDIRLVDGKVPLTYWTDAPNFGDLLAPYLIHRLTGLEVKHVFIRPGHLRKPLLDIRHHHVFSYLAIGSIASRINRNSMVWGSGTFGTENKKDLCPQATFFAARGPLTRNLVRMHGGTCPEVYGDPALLFPEIYHPKVEKKYEFGVIKRWSEPLPPDHALDPAIKIIDFGTSDIEGTIKDILACKRILSSSLHGLILADAYQIPSAWIASTTPKGLEHKFYDYFLSVEKVRKAQTLGLAPSQLTVESLRRNIELDETPIRWDPMPLLDACPLIQRG